MELTLDILEKVPVKLPESFLNAIARETLLLGLPASLTESSFSVSAVAVSQVEIQNLNHEYRNKDAVTDVLSFWNFTSQEELTAQKDGMIDLGELIFSPDFIKQAATEDEVSYQREMTYIFAHGILHLIGYDHEPEMFQIQDTVTEKLNPADQ